MKTSGSVLLALMLHFSLSAFAQEAIPAYTPVSGEAGYAENGAGYVFSPVVPMAVTALGFDSAQLNNQGAPFRVSLFDARGNQLATATVTAGSTVFDQCYYQSISPVDLTPGNTYYLGALAPSLGVWAGPVDGDVGGGSFSVNSDISYLNSALNFMPPNGAVPGTLESPGIFFVGENFQFQVVPEPSSLSLMIVAATMAMARRRR